jgi:RNA polymerase sigma-70 factor (ECF subfamily)
MQAHSEFLRVTLPHRTALERVALRMVRDGRLAEDLVQETYCRAFAARARFTPGSNARAWLFRILVNAVVDEQRRAWRTAPLDDGAVEDTQRPDPERALAVAEAEAELHRALAALPAPLARVVKLVDLDGLRYREAAARLGVPIGTVMSRLSRARDRLCANLTGAHVAAPLARPLRCAA